MSGRSRATALICNEKMSTAATRAGKPLGAEMVNCEVQIYLTDFQNRIFIDKNAKNHGFCARITVNICRVYYRDVKHDTALRNVPERPGADIPYY